MTLAFRAMVGAATLAAVCAAAVPASAAPARCGESSFSYAGVLGDTVQYGIAAHLAAVRAPSVARGHVAGWVGVGGSHLGPNGTAEWLQVGISATAAGDLSLYYEVARPGAAPRYVRLADRVAVGRAFDVAVLEARGHPGSWRVWVDGRPVTDRIALPGSHGTWRPVATAESWNGDTAGTCNGYGFRFGQLRVATRPGGAWQQLTGGRVLTDAGYHVRRRPDALVATGGI